MTRLLGLLVAIAVLLIPAMAMAYAPPLPKVPLYDSIAPNGKYEKVKPPVITLTGCGSGWPGGRTGHYSTGGSHRRPNFGHLNWTAYGYTDADAAGVEWGRFGGESVAEAPFRIDATAQLHFFNANKGVFTKLTLTLQFNDHVYPRSLRDKTQAYQFTHPVQRGS